MRTNTLLTWTGSGTVTGEPHYTRSGNEYIALSISITGTATVEIDGRATPLDTWAILASFPASDSLPVVRYPEMRARVVSTSGPATVRVGTGESVKNAAPLDLNINTGTTNTAPTVAFASGPANGATITQGASTVYTATATDAQDGTITSAIRWFVDGADSGVTGGSFNASSLSVGSHTIQPRATDSGSLTGSASSRTLTVQAVAGNVAPVANFTFTPSDLAVAFTDASSDSDGTIASRAWNFGDSGTSTQTNPSHTYASAGTYTVALTVTDNGGATHTVSKSVTVTAAGTPAPTQFSDAFAGQTIGAAPAGWTLGEAGAAGDYLIASSTDTTFSDRRVALQSPSVARRVLYWDAVGTDLADGQMLVAASTTLNTTTATQVFSLLLRASHSTNGLTAYAFQMYQATGGAGVIRITKYIDGASPVEIGVTSADVWNPSTTYWLRATISGSTLTVDLFPYVGSYTLTGGRVVFDEGAKLATLTVTDTSITGAGAAGTLLNTTAAGSFQRISVGKGAGVLAP